MTKATEFVLFPFNHKGIEFVSKVSTTSPYLNQIINLGDEFIQLNKMAVDELINLDEQTSMLAIEKAIEIINEGGTEMFLELAGA